MFIRAAFAIFLATACRVSAQLALPDDLSTPPPMIAAPPTDADAPTVTQAPPASAWLDLRQTMSRNSKTQEAPAWVEALTLLPGELTEGGTASKSIFRIRVTPPGPEYKILFFRLFFDDKPNQQPELVAWDETGTHILRSGTLGAGMNLPSSDSVIIPMTGASAIDIEVPGDGKTIRAAYLDWMTSSEVVHPVNAEHRDIIPEPFSVVPALHAPPEDVENFGTVTATLASEAIHLDGRTHQDAVFQFPIEAEPLTALLTFEIENPRIDAPPEIYVNGQDIGPASLTLPDLADPGYRGEAEPLTTEMHFNYTGWLRAQKIVPATALKVGANDLVVTNGPGRAVSAIRATQIQLKYIWDKSDYLLRTGQ
ncbi:MAG TPA: hypothetical protein VIW07_04010 [Candidatus Udaeobacter sp.]